MSEDETSNRRRGEQQLDRSGIVDELKEFFNRKFNDLKTSVQSDSEWIAEATRKKVRKDSSVSLKGLSNRKQYQFNSDIDDLLDSIDKAITLRQAPRAHSYIKEAKDLIRQRNKLIRIADSSPSGWSTIQEYEQLDVASDSEDDKRIRKAEERAKNRIDKAKSSASATVTNNSGVQSNFRSFRRGTGPRNTLAGGTTYQQQFPSSVVCYRCGQLGHIASVCGQVNTDFQRGAVGPTNVVKLPVCDKPEDTKGSSQ